MHEQHEWAVATLRKKIIQNETFTILVIKISYTKCFVFLLYLSCFSNFFSFVVFFFFFSLFIRFATGQHLTGFALLNFLKRILLFINYVHPEPLFFFLLFLFFSLFYFRLVFFSSSSFVYRLIFPTNWYKTTVYGSGTTRQYSTSWMRYREKYLVQKNGNEIKKA